MKVRKLFSGVVFAGLATVAVSQASSQRQTSVVKIRGLDGISATSNQTVFVSGFDTKFPKNKVVGYGLLWKIRADHVSVKKLPFTGQVDRMFWFDSQRGGVIGIGYGRFETVDGSQTWEKINSPNDLGYFSFFLKPDLGWYFGGDEFLHRVDGDKVSKLMGFGFSQIKKIQFTDAQNGWVFDIVDTRSRFQRSADGGANWSTINIDDSDLRAFQFIDNSHGFALTDKGLYESVDNGNSWRYLTVNPRESWHGKLFFLDEKKGWIMGSDVCRTKDGGVTWSCYQLNNEVRKKWFTDFVFIDEKRGWLLTEEGLYRTTNGGKDWNRQMLSFQNLSF